MKRNHGVKAMRPDYLNQVIILANGYNCRGNTEKNIVDRNGFRAPARRKMGIAYDRY